MRAVTAPISLPPTLRTAHPTDLIRTAVECTTLDHIVTIGLSLSVAGSRAINLQLGDRTRNNDDTTFQRFSFCYHEIIMKSYSEDRGLDLH